MALWDIYFVSKFIPKVLNKVSFNFFYEDNNFLSLRLIELAFLLIFDAVSKVVITAPSQKKNCLSQILGYQKAENYFQVWHQACCIKQDVLRNFSNLYSRKHWKLSLLNVLNK